jgi:excisionase family DNA binding protein
MPKTLLTASEVAEQLRLNIETMYRLIQNEALPAIKVGRQWRFVEADIQRWMGDRRRAQVHGVDEGS